MPHYSCELCKFFTKLKTDYKRHLKTKKHLSNLERNTLKSQKEPKRAAKEPQKSQKEPKRAAKEPALFLNTIYYFCIYCNEKFSTFANKRRHEIHRCSENNNKSNEIGINEKIKNIEKKHEQEKKQLYKNIKKLIEKTGNVTNIQNTQNIKLNNYGNEDLSHITDNLKTNLLKLPYGMIPKMIEEVHFSDDKPENKNIELTNSRDNKLKVFTGDKWIYKNKEETINDLLDGKYFILDSHYENICDDFNNVSQSRYETFRSFFDEKDKKMYEQLKKECELVLLNNR